MKLIERKKLTKQIKYFGLLLSVPVWTTYVATDDDGEVYAYEQKPSKDRLSWFLFEVNLQFVATVNLEGLNWAETLKEV